MCVCLLSLIASGECRVIVHSRLIHLWTTSPVTVVHTAAELLITRNISACILSEYYLNPKRLLFVAVAYGESLLNSRCSKIALTACGTAGTFDT